MLAKPLKPDVEPTVFGLSSTRTSPPRRWSWGASSTDRILACPCSTAMWDPPSSGPLLNTTRAAIGGCRTATPPTRRPIAGIPGRAAEAYVHWVYEGYRRILAIAGAAVNGSAPPG